MVARRTTTAGAALAALAAAAALAAVAVVRNEQVALLSLDPEQALVEKEALAWFKHEHPHTAALIGDAQLAKEAAQTTNEVVPHRPHTLLKTRSAAALPSGWYRGAVALGGAEWDQHLGAGILRANGMTLAKVSGSSAPSKAEETAGSLAATLARLRLLPMTKDAASSIKCDDHDDCLHEHVYSRFLAAGEQGHGCPAGEQCELHQVWLKCGGKQGVCPVYLYARAPHTTLRAKGLQQLQAASPVPSVVLDEPKYPAVDASKLARTGAGRPAVWASSQPSDYNKKAWNRGEFATGAHSEENTETYDHLKIREMQAGKGKLASGDVHGPEGRWATRLPSDDNKQARTWHPSRVKAEPARAEADGKLDAGTLRWKKTVVYAKVGRAAAAAADCCSPQRSIAWCCGRPRV